MASKLPKQDIYHNITNLKRLLYSTRQVKNIMNRQLTPSLPIAQYEAQIVELTQKWPAVVISGKTGCGKSTQVPQYLLRANHNAKIAICQPRRVAATSLAVRVSQQMGCKLGTKVGYHIGMESFSDQKCSIVYMTYGILIQQLLFSKNLPYTHIILDEIHERSLEMDFAFVALKISANKQNANKAKLIIMSATINSELFCNYFCSDQKNFFYIPQLCEGTRLDKPRIRGRNSDKQSQYFEVVPPGPQFQPAPKLVLPEENKFKININFLQDIGVNEDYYVGDDEQRIPDQAFQKATNLILKLRKQNVEGDYLIFLPGLAEIRNLRDLLVLNKIDPESIVQVHSLFSDELYHNLFLSKIKNKLILATNIGESSITLPFCRVVIDFCLTRKNFSKERGVTRLQTKLASKANLTQRCGRVGRVSDGDVYHLISKVLYQKLSHFERPEIQCVALEMVILRIKQIDQNGQAFRNPYSFLLSTLSPPEIKDIRQALKLLVDEEALSSPTGSLNVLDADHLQMTELGSFMVEMPCELRISKMILMGLKLGVPIQIISIASILISSKQFFLHQERRVNIEQFMHSLVGYDSGRYNDFLLRMKIFNHWKNEFYEKSKENRSFMKKRYISKQIQVQQLNNVKRVYVKQRSEEDILQFLEAFNQEKWSEKQKIWCAERGISPNVMRELIGIEENLKIRLTERNFKFPQIEPNYNLLILFCLDYGFPDNDCEIKWPSIKAQKQKDGHLFIQIQKNQSLTQQNIENFIYPEKGFSIQKINEKTLRLYANESILSKFILPKYYSKAQLKNVSNIYYTLAKNGCSHRFNYEVTLNMRQAIVLNQSICKAIIPYKLNSKYKLITHRCTEIGVKKMINMGALVEEKSQRIMQIINNKDIELMLHFSKQFFNAFRTEGKVHELDFILRAKDVEEIKAFRKLIGKGKNIRPAHSEGGTEILDAEKLMDLLQTKYIDKYQRQVWEFYYQLERNKKVQQNFFPIDNLPQMSHQNFYFKDYNDWKRKKYLQFYQFYRPLFLDTIYIICKQCHEVNCELTDIQQISMYNPKTQVLSMNQYSGSWMTSPKNKDLSCKRSHVIGKVIGEQQSIINENKVLLYIPHKRIEKLWKCQDWPSKEQIQQMIAIGKNELLEAKQKMGDQQCIFCFEFYNSSNEAVHTKFERQLLRKDILKKYLDHVKSHKHLMNISKFTKNLNIL